MILQRLNNRKGFTLIELMVIIAIICILAAIVVPRFIKFREKKRVIIQQEEKVIVEKAPLSPKLKEVEQNGKMNKL